MHERAPKLGDWVSKLGYDILFYFFKVVIKFRNQMWKSLQYAIKLIKKQYLNSNIYLEGA